MAMQPMSMPASLLIFKDIAFRGFWLSGGWAKRAGPAGRAALLDRLAELYGQGSLIAPRCGSNLGVSVELRVRCAVSGS
jgi:trans-2-enoyl-CoA reductase